ncbi:hypothetical protein CANARDRAFT_199363 [[Candida] arabinofermentans NRRL YB-2248]|uniref:PH-response regulator protein palI/RIM9 n=1 Tax=[Candida] arabinofermentans NRRL YB-2248 TaxID=983967 RepID=A0A1E4T0V1_9ASCO|nr:hypothetical protein CANARDRAFT_199363 [[Candida] arabinofermentans NRRL YB-2248]
MRFHAHTVALLFQAASIAFLLVATLTVPIFDSISLAVDDDYKYGVFGYCSIDSSSGTTCSSVSSHYKPSTLGSTSDWKMSSASRDRLALLLLVAPIGAGLTLISLVFSFFCHFKAFGKSKSFWITALVFNSLSFIASALICVVVFLLFFPHLNWCAWVLIPAALLNLISVILTGLASKSNIKHYKNHSQYDEKSDENSLINGTKDTSFFKANSFNSDQNRTGHFSLPPQISSYDHDMNSTKSTEKPADFTDFYKTNMSYSNTFTDKDSTRKVQEISKNAPSLRLPDIINPYGSSSSVLAHEPVFKTSHEANQSSSVEVKGSGSPLDNRLDSLDDETHSLPLSDQSDFTSVSQREINPKYYKGAPQKTTFPGQFQPPMQQQYMGIQQQQYNMAPPPPPHSQQQPQQFPLSMQYYPQQHMPPAVSGPYVSQAPVPSQFYQPQPKPKTNRADVLFNNNPDFNLGQQNIAGALGTGSRPGVRRYGAATINHQRILQQGEVLQHVSNGGYKNRRPPFPAASYSNDSPYGRL